MAAARGLVVNGSTRGSRTARAITKGETMTHSDTIAQFQRDADALLRDLLKATAEQEPHLMQDDLLDCFYCLCGRIKAAFEEEYVHYPIRTNELIDKIFANAGDRIALWLEIKRRELERENLRVVGEEEEDDD
jgi:hypothetical protein